MIIIYSIILILITGATYIIFPHIVKLYLRQKSISKFSRRDSIILSFDDGPNPSITEEILDILEENKSTAMFFVTGQNAEKYPETVKKVIKKGHILGIHGFDHIHPWKSDPLKTFVDFRKSKKFFQNLEKSLNYKIKFYRPPYGKYNLISLILYFFYGKKPVFWNLDPKDFENDNPDQIFSNIQKDIAPGKIILLHDGRYKKDSDASVTKKALIKIFENSATNQFRYSVSEIS